MLTKADLTTSAIIEGWLRDLALTPIQRPDGVNNWNVEFTVTGSPNLGMNVVNPKAFPRAVMLICGLTPVPAQVAAFLRLDQDHRLAFWKDLRDPAEPRVRRVSARGSARDGVPEGAARDRRAFR